MYKIRIQDKNPTDKNLSENVQNPSHINKRIIYKKKHCKFKKLLLQILMSNLDNTNNIQYIRLCIQESSISVAYFTRL